MTYEVYTPPQRWQHQFPIWMKNHCKGSGPSSFSGNAEGIGISSGKCRWNASTAAATPSSFSINFANSIARDFTWESQSPVKNQNLWSLWWVSLFRFWKRNANSKITSGCSINLTAFERFSTVSWDIGIGAGPSPFCCTLSPQKNWSPKKGTMVVGHCN